MKNLSIILSLLLIGNPIYLNAQNDCSDYVDRAKAYYKKGLLDQVVAAITACSASETDQVRQWQSSRLLAQAYLGLNNAKLAKASVEDMLEKNPLYEPSAIEDSKEFVKLINSVTVLPRFSLSLSTVAGLNISYPNVVKSYGITDNKKTYENGKAKQLGLSTGYTFSKRLSLHTGAIYTENNYALKYSVQNLNFKYSEKLNYLQMPLFARFQIKYKGKFKIFAQAGFVAAYLTNAKYSISKSSQSLENANLIDIDLTNRRSKITYGAFTGLGLSYQFKEGHIFTEINYQHSFTNINNSSSRLEYDALAYNYFFIDDDLRLNNLTFSVGYSFYLNYYVKRSK